jgi:protein SCO1/2
MPARLLAALTLISGCWGSNAHILQGEVIEVRPPHEVVIRHDDVPGLMPAMTMPFSVRDPSLLDGLEPGDKVFARLIAEDEGWWLAAIRETRAVSRSDAQPAPPAAAAAPIPPPPLRAGQILPAHQIPLADGTTMTVGAGQRGPVLLTFLYTTCPQPEFCPAITARLQGLQAGLRPGEATLLAVTIDPDGDTPETLRAYADAVSADPAVWKFGRLPEPELKALAGRAALTVDTVTGGTEILHSIRLLVLDADGRLVERYDDARFPADRVLEQLRTGGPKAPADSDGTLTPAHPPG